ncbi:MAG: FAD-binding oxidoreductase [candidate division NC10 bacterium]|nr:FAD-binding oxidoreductase [candidate division NC10 bacterium]
MGDPAGLARRAQEIVGAEHVRTGPAAAPFAVDGLTPGVVAAPGSEEEVSRLLAAAEGLEAAVTPWGGGTKTGLGNPPRRLDLVLSLARLNRVVDHEPGDMTATLQAGMTLAAAQAHLTQKGQFIALDPAAAARATVGGILAANASGPRRLRYGTARDLVIAVRIVHADGAVTKGGAKVVKNVTGYDMNKLYVGSLGTLGILTEVTFRLYPLPPTEETHLSAFPTLEAAGAAAAEILGSPLVPHAVELLSAAAAAAAARAANVPWSPGQVGLAVMIGSVPDAVHAQLADVARFCRGAGSAADHHLRGAAHSACWEAVREFPGPDAPRSLILKGSVPLTRVPELMSRGEGLAGQRHLACQAVAEVGPGIVRFSVDAGGVPPERAADYVETVRGVAAELGGHLVVLEAPLDVKRRVDVWGPVGKALRLMQGLKAQFDPKGILNPGRFVGGI